MAFFFLKRERERERRYRGESVMASVDDENDVDVEEEEVKESRVAAILGKTMNGISTIGQGVESAFSAARPYFHYAYVPLIIYLGMRTEPRPSIFQIISPL